MAYFSEITGAPFPVSSALDRLVDISQHFSKANIQYFEKSYGGLVKLLA